MSKKEIIQSNIAGLNPTGLLDYNGTLNMVGSNTIVLNSEELSKKNLDKVNNNQVVCNNIENFTNIYNMNMTNNITDNINNNINNNYNYFLLILLILTFMFLLLIY